MLISSTAATGTEGNPASVLTKWATHEKAVLWDPGAYPAVSIVDPELMLSLSLEVTRDGAFDIMVHMLENYFSGNDKCSFQDRTTEGMVLGVMENMEILEKDLGNLCARENLSWASITALLAGGGPGFGRGGIFTVHNLEHALSGTVDVSHGHGLAALWVPYLRFLLPKREAKIAQFGKACLGLAELNVEKSIAAMEAWLKAHKLWFKLSELGVTDDMIPKMAADTIRIYGEGKNFLPAPVRVTKEKAEEIYRSAM
jgi:alcohol dehydrogenase YqhD (iron-dependent ADH family)